MSALSDVLSDLNSVQTQINTYLNGIKAYLDGTSNALPFFEDVISSIETDALLTQTDKLSGGLVSYNAGGITKNIYFTASIFREFDLRNNLKADFYNQASSEYSQLSSNIAADQAKNANLIRSSSPEQTKG